MATPLSDEIRALITFANETTEAGDTKLGDCVKTLVEGYNGGKNIPSSPMVVPSGALSSRIAALLAYANETTGAGDTTMGDAIRTLCEGYGGGELIFYEKLVTDGVAVVKTDYRPSSETTQSVYFKGVMPTYKAGAVWWGCEYSSSQSAAWWKMYQSSSTNTGYRRYNYVAFGSTTRSYNTFSSGTVISDIEAKATKVSSTSFNLDSKTGAQTVNANKSINAQYTGTWQPMSVLGNTNYLGVASCNLPSGSYVKKFEVEDAELGTLTYVPCTYNGEAGLWCLQTETFFGNAASSGQFTVEGYPRDEYVSEPIVVWDASDMNGYSKTMWLGKGRFCNGQAGSTTDKNSGGGAMFIAPSMTIINDKTVFLPIRLLPRYVAITEFTTTNKFPVSHIGRMGIEARDEGWRTFQALRNLNSSLYHIFNLGELVNTYYEPLDGYEPALAIRTNMNTFVGCDDLEALQNYLNQL